VGDGIFAIDGNEADALRAEYREAQRNFKIEKFVPASGAATRMFKDLFSFVESGEMNPIVEKLSANIEKFAFAEALGDKRGIERYGSFALPMDEVLVLAAVDFSGRCYLGYGLSIPAAKVGSFDTELCEEFFMAFARSAACNLHLRQLAGKNSHHIIEAASKACARALKAAVAQDPRIADQLPSTKGSL
jgi:hypothetical protein